MSHSCRVLWGWFLLAVLGLFAACIARADTLPARPTAYFTDQAGIVSAADAQALNHRLAEFERETTNQILVVVYPQMESTSSIEDFTVRAAQQWQVGQKGRNNGAVLFVFPKDRRMYIQVGYGLEGALPDAVCSEIINQQIKPHFQAGDYAGGLSAGIDSMISATRGEYHGNGTTQGERAGSGNAGVNPPAIGFFIILMLIVGWFGRRRQSRIWPGSSRGGFGGGPWLGGGGSSGGGGSNDSFSSGGGSFGGGGAGGSW